MPSARRAIALLVLSACFIGQTALVYSDDPGPTQLDATATRGAEVWHEQNCQACHQLYGYGGFLGPDLTNFATRGDEARLGAWLAAGPGAMPAFELPPDDQAALWAWLQAIDSTGVGQAREMSWWEYR
ncbi:MAG: cytochrome c [Proteobacteria bacterium]|nr:cytochrome c [Pseudomonadota bacterium]MCP4916543.1 cytochrome c [Pseudomonadota bacterium]